MAACSEFSLIKKLRTAAQVVGAFAGFPSRRRPIIRCVILSAKGRAEKLGNKIELDDVLNVASLLLSGEYSAEPGRFLQVNLFNPFLRIVFKNKKAIFWNRTCPRWLAS